VPQLASHQQDCRKHLSKQLSQTTSIHKHPFTATVITALADHITKQQATHKSRLASGRIKHQASMEHEAPSTVMISHTALHAA
jgi:hypothetical protein